MGPNRDPWPLLAALDRTWTGLDWAGLGSGPAQQRVENYPPRRNFTRHSKPAGNFASGLGSSNRTPNVPLAASITRSTITTRARYVPPTGSPGRI